MKFHTLSLLLLALLIQPAAAQLTIGFSAAEGYSDGRLHLQPGEGQGWREQRPGAYTVDAEKGVLKFDSSAQQWTLAALTQSLGFAKVYIFVVDFQVTIGSPTLSGADSVMNRFNLMGNDGPMVASFRQKGGGNSNSFDIWLHAAVGSTPYPSVQSRSFSGTDIGLATNSSGTKYEKNVSDKMRLVLVHRHDDSGFSFTSAASLLNLDKDSEIRRVTLPGWSATEDWFNQTDKKFAISTGNMNARTAGDGSTSFTIHSLRIGTGMK